MTLRGLSARNGVKIWSSSMACPPGRPACYLLSFQHLTTHQAGAKGLRQATLEGVGLQGATASTPRPRTRYHRDGGLMEARFPERAASELDQRAVLQDGGEHLVGEGVE